MNNPQAMWTKHSFNLTDVGLWSLDQAGNHLVLYKPQLYHLIDKLVNHAGQIGRAFGWLHNNILAKRIRSSSTGFIGIRQDVGVSKGYVSCIPPSLPGAFARPDVLQPADNAQDQTVIIQNGGGTTLIMRPNTQKRNKRKDNPVIIRPSVGGKC